MRKLIKRLCVIALLATTQGAAWAEDRACEFAEWGYSYIKVDHQGETWTYLLTTSGPKWRNDALGYHAPGQLVCETCSSAGPAFGPYHFSAQADVDASPPAKSAATVTERAERREEFVGYPYVRLDRDRLAHRASREDIVIGPLAGYAIAYRLVAKDSEKDVDWSKFVAEGQRGLLVIHLTDGCASFETSILHASHNESSPWAVLDSLLAETSIEKRHGAHSVPIPRGSPYGAVVKPRRDRGQ